MMLEIHGLNSYYGSIHALKGIDLSVEQGEIVTLIGSNGAGKSTTLLSIAGIQPSTPESNIMFNGQDLRKMSSQEIVENGIVLTPEGREVFPGLSVSDNLKIGAYTINDQKKINDGYERVYSLFPRLKERMKQPAATLSGGEQQMLAIGRSLMSAPKLLMLDEPSMGLAPNLVAMIFRLIRDINKQGVTILLVEQNANMALKIAKRGYVLETGRIKLSGASEDLASNDEVRKAYLGA